MDTSLVSVHVKPPPTIRNRYNSLTAPDSVTFNFSILLVASTVTNAFPM